MATACRKLQREIEDLTFSKSCLERQYATLEGELNVARTEVSRLKLSIAQLTSSQALVNAELETTKVAIKKPSCAPTKCNPSGFPYFLNSLQ